MCACHGPSACHGLFVCLFVCFSFFHIVIHSILTRSQIDEANQSLGCLTLQPKTELKSASI